MARAFALDVTARVIGQLALLIVARLLQPEGFGAFLVAWTAFSLVLVFTDFGMQDLALQTLSGRDVHTNEHRIFTTSRLGIAVVATIIAAPTALTAALMGSTYAAIPILLLGLVPATYITNINIKYRIREQFVRAGLASGAFVALLAAGSLGGALVRRSAEAASVGAVAALFAGAAVWAAVDRETLARLSRSRLYDLARDSKPFLLTALCVALYSRGDRFVVASLAGPFDAGLYGAAYSLIFAASLLTLAVQAVALPHLVRSWQRRLSWRVDTFRFLRILAISGVGIGAITCLLSTVLVRVMYGGSFAGSADLLRVLSALIPLYFVNTGLGMCLIASKKQGALARITALNLCVAVVAYPSLTLAFGAAGAGVASVMVELCGLCMLFRRIKETFGDLTDHVSTSKAASRLGASGFGR